MQPQVIHRLAKERWLSHHISTPFDQDFTQPAKPSLISIGLSLRCNWSKPLKTAKIFDHGFHRYHGWVSGLFYP
jgi:hypothetical protein